VQEHPEYLAAQLITYLGNKRSLLGFIGGALDRVREALGKDRLTIADMFSGSGAVSRFFKRYAEALYVCDIEPYAETIGRCYLPDAPGEPALRAVHGRLLEDIGRQPREGFLAELYAPKDIHCIRQGERCFFTPRNARYLDTARQHIDRLPPGIRHYFIAPLLAEASVKANTAGVFKGFYKNKEGTGQFGGSARPGLQPVLLPGARLPRGRERARREPPARRSDVPRPAVQPAPLRLELFHAEPH
jgi:adenine-specific DNA-methyltransferase